jgi:hypothetical protein
LSTSSLSPFRLFRERASTSTEPSLTSTSTIPRIFHSAQKSVSSQLVFALDIPAREAHHLLALPSSPLASVSRFINKLGAELNLALAKTPIAEDAQPREQDFNRPNRTPSTNANAIQSIRLVKGTPFYGYHVGFCYYLRIAFLKHSHRWTLLKVLGEDGLIQARKFEVYEAHLGFVLQFMVDFGLGGCGWLDIQDARFREPLRESRRS